MKIFENHFLTFEKFPHQNGALNYDSRGKFIIKTLMSY